MDINKTVITCISLGLLSEYDAKFSGVPGTPLVYKGKMSKYNRFTNNHKVVGPRAGLKAKSDNQGGI